MTGASILKNYFYRLYKSLLERHIKSQSLKPTDEEEDCVKAFCVLAHAAIEEFLENLCRETLRNGYLKYKSKKIISSIPNNIDQLDYINLAIIQLIETLVLASNFSTFSSKESSALKDYKSKLDRVTEIYQTGSDPTMNSLTEVTKKTDSYAKEILKDTNRFFKEHIESNHGASLKYFLRLLIPVGIDIPNTLYLNSLQKLADYRGTFAHGKGFVQILSASDLAAYAIDVIKLCNLIEKGLDNFENI